MSGIYKTPGVYVEEIPKFPPSIAAVETAIPAFIGYTERDTLKGEDLKIRAVPIDSIAEFEEVFGKAPAQRVVVELTALNNFEAARPETAFYLYDSLRMFYANGGGKCYIITLGIFPTSTSGLDTTPYAAAFAALEKEDEPTLIVMPDSVHLSGNGLYDVQQFALKQCNKLMDRFVICDLKKAVSNNDFDATVGGFRDNIGINYLKYAAAYGPWINASLPRFLLRRNVPIVRTGTTAPDILDTLVSDAELKQLITTIDDVEGSVDGLAALESSLSGTFTNLDDELAKRLDDFRNINTPTNATQQTALQAIMTFYMGILNDIRTKETNAPNPATTLFKLKSDLEKFRLNSGLGTALKSIASHHKSLNSNTSAPTITLLANDDLATYLGYDVADAKIKATAATLVAVADLGIAKANADLADTAATAAAAITDATALALAVQSSKVAAAAAIVAANAAAAAADSVGANTEADNARNDVAIVEAVVITDEITAAAAAAAIATLVTTVGNIGPAITAANPSLTYIMLQDTMLPDYNTRYTAAANDQARANIALSGLIEASTPILNVFRFYAQTINNYEVELNKSLLENFGFYKELMGKASEALNLIPPSGAVAGIYAATDRDRGVWKAPANVSLSAVIGPGVKISHEDQMSLNVDVIGGKSINIIRAFTGKGILVWGARTLAGNDNEWRYISVRRFFNFVEESVKKATEQFVFEPNDANTWVRVQAMIENFLNTLWRQGALQGVKPEHAYYVAVGLGKTMTPLDILEGRMIVEIGMAAVRPAEFIILRFSHKMAES
jgi:phage tail sheath protein FI